MDDVTNLEKSPRYTSALREPKSTYNKAKEREEVELEHEGVEEIGNGKG